MHTRASFLPYGDLKVKNTFFYKLQVYVLSLHHIRLPIIYYNMVKRDMTEIYARLPRVCNNCYVPHSGSWGYSTVTHSGSTSSTLILFNTSGLLYALEITVVYGFGIRLHGMCEVPPYMEATTTCCVTYISYIPHFVVLYHLYTTERHFDLYLKCGTYIRITVLTIKQVVFVMSIYSK